MALPRTLLRGANSYMVLLALFAGAVAGCTSPGAPLLPPPDSSGTPAPDPSTPSDPTVPAAPVRSTDEFVQSVGVNVHVSYLNTPYDRDLAPLLKPLGVRRLRDGGGVFPNAGWMDEIYGRMRALAAAGYRFTLVMAPLGGTTDYSKADHVATVGTQLGASAIDAFEGLNEHDNDNVSAWVTQTRTFQRALAAAVRGNAALKSIPIIAPSVTSAGAATALGDLSDAADFGNMHSYPGGQSPLPSLQSNLQMVRAISASRRVMATETGYHDDLVSPGHPGVSDAAMAKYVPRTVLEYYRAGVPRTFLYELIESSTIADAAHLPFGLIRANGQPKLAYTALGNLMTLLADSGTGTRPATFAYSVVGDTTDVHRVALARRDGKVSIVLWLEKPSFDVTAEKPISVPTRRLVVKLGRQASRVAVYRPVASRTPIQQPTNVSSVTVDVPDEPLIIRITP